VKSFEIRVLRDAFSTGIDSGGWRRDPATWRTQVKAFEHRTGTERVELEPGAAGEDSSVRILLRDDPAGEWTVHADCKYRSSLSLILILIAYRMVNRRHSIDYRAGRAEALRDVQVAVGRVW
jgi:hypothetical protein